MVNWIDSNVGPTNISKLVVEIIDGSNNTLTTTTTTQQPLVYTTTNRNITTESYVLMLEVLTDNEQLTYNVIVCCLVTLLPHEKQTEQPL